MEKASRASRAYLLIGIGLGWIWGVAFLPTLMLSLFPHPVEEGEPDGAPLFFVPFILLAIGTFLLAWSPRKSQGKEAEGSGEAP